MRDWTALESVCQSGALPVAEKLLAEGAYADNCLSPLPTLTSTNWTTIATGAWPGTHGITDFNIHKSGDDLMDCPQAFDSGDCQAEYIWNAAARQGKRTILLNYPATWPPVVENGVQIGGAGIEPTDWRLGLPAEDRRVSLGAEQLFSTEGEPLSNEIHWNGETVVTLRFAFAESLSPVATEVDLVCRVTADGGVTIHGAGAETAEVDPGSWSETIRMELDIGDERVIGICRAKLLDLDRERNIFRLFFTDVCAVDGLVSPHDALGDLERVDGLPVATVGFNAVSLGWIDLGTFVEILDMSNRWMEQVAVHLIEREQWDLFFMHIHSIDWFYHVASTKLDSTQNADEGERRLYEQAELRIYESMDRMMGAILSAAEDEPHLTVVVSDHGATSYTRHAPTREILVEAGLIVADETQPSPDLEPSHDDLVANWERAYWEPTDTVDWTRTLAVPQRSCYVYINLKGRDPHGVVEERDYEDVQERIRDALLSYRDPQTGLCPTRSFSASRMRAYSACTATELETSPTWSVKSSATSTARYSGRPRTGRDSARCAVSFCCTGRASSVARASSVRRG